jgi:DNA modification methylase
LRDYGHEGQIGAEASPEAFVAALVAVFREVRRVLRDDGTCWVNLGDSYVANRGMGNSGRHVGGDTWGGTGMDKRGCGLKPKDLVGIPWAVAFALRGDGWWLRSDIIWAKPNVMPESVSDRPTKAHEYLFLLSKSERYFYDADAIRERHVDERPNKTGATARRGQVAMKPTGKNDSPDRWFHAGGRNARTVWTIPTHSFDEAHFATFPEELPRRCILAGTSEQGACARCGAPMRRVLEAPVEGFKDYEGKWAEQDKQSSGRRMLGRVRAAREAGGSHENPFPEKKTLGWEPSCECGDTAPRRPCVVLDPFAGSGTTCAVADAHQRDFYGIELNPEYADMARRRVFRDGAPLFSGRTK